MKQYATIITIIGFMIGVTCLVWTITNPSVLGIRLAIAGWVLFFIFRALLPDDL